MKVASQSGARQSAAKRRLLFRPQEHIAAAFTQAGGKLIPLTRGFVALVDSEDYERLAAFNWHVHIRDNCIYAARNITLAIGQYAVLPMHRDILGITDPSVHIDHRRHYSWGVDNRRENLRICTESQNAANRRRRADNISGFKGVCWSNKRQMWRADAMINGKWRTIGFFETKEEAAAARDRAHKSSFGEFALLNVAS